MGRVRLGLDLLIDHLDELGGRPFALLCHQASVTGGLEPAHLALHRRGASPRVLLGPEHGFYGVEQDMVAARESVDPWTGRPILSLYGDDESSLRPDPAVFQDVELLVIDLQDVGSRYYTFAATAIWSAAAAIEEGCEVWVLDRPNPLGGAVVEGNLLRPGFESFVGAFRTPVRHGLTLGELARLEAIRQGWSRGSLRVWEMEGWSRSMLWPATGLPWLAPSPNMPDFETAVLYPGGCLIEATELSEGRGTTRPFRLIGAPSLDPPAFAERLASLGHDGVAAIPCYFRPQFQKHAGERCGGVELVVTDAATLSGLRFGVELLASVRELLGESFRWRQQAYEFVDTIPAIDLLAGSDGLRLALEAGEGSADWVAAWRQDEAAFLEEREPALLYGG